MAVRLANVEEVEGEIVVAREDERRRVHDPQIIGDRVAKFSRS
jgi:hypothetical protein